MKDNLFKLDKNPMNNKVLLPNFINIASVHIQPDSKSNTFNRLGL